MDEGFQHLTPFHQNPLNLSYLSFGQVAIFSNPAKILLNGFWILNKASESEFSPFVFPERKKIGLHGEATYLNSLFRRKTPSRWTGRKEMNIGDSIFDTHGLLQFLKICADQTGHDK